MSKDIVNKLYKAYGSGSGVLFGIDNKEAVQAIVEFTINHLQPIPVNQDENELWKVAKNMVHESSMSAYISDLALDKLKQHFTLQLKSSPEPTPVQEGLREDELWVDVIDHLAGEIEFESKSDLFNMLSSNYSITKKQSPVHPEKKEK